MFNLKSLFESLISEAMQDEQEEIPTESLPSALIIAKRIAELENVLLSCKAWHHGDAWRDSKDSVERMCWEDHLRRIDNVLNNVDDGTGRNAV